MSGSELSKPDEAILDQIKRRLMETGDWDRISRLLRAQLDESGWEDDLKDMAKERARAQETPSLQNLLAEITPRAQSVFKFSHITHNLLDLVGRYVEGDADDGGTAMIQPNIRIAVIQEIEAVLEREVEKA